MDIANFKELFNCPLCDKLFNTDIRSPKILSCGHSFCLACLEKLFSSIPQCPTCKLTIQFSSVDFIPVNFLIESCISKINTKSGINGNDSSEFKDAQNTDNLNPSILSSTSTQPGLSSKRRKLMCEGFCNEHENYNELRCMNCEAWICSMCAALHHKQCNTLLVEDAYGEIKKKNSQIIEKELDICKLRVSRVSESIQIIENKKILLKQEIENYKLKIEEKLDELQNNEFQFKELQELKDKENNFSCKINEIQILNNNLSCNKDLLALKTELDNIVAESKSRPNLKSPCSVSFEVQFDPFNEIKEEFLEPTIEKEEFDRLKPDIISTESYLPAIFTNLPLKLLNGDTMSSRDQAKAKNRLVKEIMVYLNDKELLTSKDPISNRNGYSLLGDQLLRTYQNFTWYSNGPEKSHPCQGLITQLSNRRRQQRYRSRKRQHASVFSPIQSLEKLENFLSEDFHSANIKKLLRDSYPLRRGPVKKLPSYLFSKDAMLCEIGLRMKKNTNTLLYRLIYLEKKFQVFSQNPYASISDVEEYFRTATSTDRFLTICNENIEPPISKKNGPCVILSEVDAVLHLYDFNEEKFILLKGSFNMYEACLVGFGSYFIMNLAYPKEFAQFFRLLEIFLEVSRKTFISSQNGKKLKALLEFLK